MAGKLYHLSFRFTAAFFNLLFSRHIYHVPYTQFDPVPAALSLGLPPVVSPLQRRAASLLRPRKIPVGNILQENHKTEQYKVNERFD